MTPTYQPEIERKYEVPEGAAPRWQELPRLRVEAEPQIRGLEAAYFDTASGRLADFGVALRRRRGGPDEGWHLKFREGGLKREVHVPLLKTADRLPAQMRQLVSGLLGREELVALAAVRTQRQVLEVHDPEHGRVAEICLDEVCGTEQSTGITRAWQEYEVELVNGTDADGRAVFDEIEAVLLEAGLTPSSSSAKIARTLGAEDDAPAVTLTGPDGEPVEAPGAPATTAESSDGKKDKKSKKDKKAGKKAEQDGRRTGEKDDGPAMGPEPSVDETVRELVRGSVDEVLWIEFILRVGGDEAIHRLRSAVRRSEALILGLLPDLADPEAGAQVLEQLRDLSQQLSAARDAEVVVEELPGRAEAVGPAVSRSALAHLLSLARQGRESTAASATRLLSGTRHRAVTVSLRDWALEARLNPEAAQLSPKKLGSRMFQRWLDGVLEIGPVPPELQDLDAVLAHVHRVRREMRLLHFGTQTFETSALRARKSQLALLEGTQGYLEACGELMDSVVLDTWCAAAARSLIRSGGDRYGVGVLHGRERALLQARGEDSVLILEELFDRLGDTD